MKRLNLVLKGVAESCVTGIILLKEMSKFFSRYVRIYLAVGKDASAFTALYIWHKPDFWANSHMKGHSIVEATCFRTSKHAHILIPKVPRHVLIHDEQKLYFSQIVPLK